MKNDGENNNASTPSSEKHRLKYVIVYDNKCVALRVLCRYIIIVTR